MDNERAIPFKNQNYAELRAQHDENNLFEDPEFPANDSSLYYSQNKPYGVQWLRPKEARQNAEFVVDGYDRTDMDQGSLGNCWFIAACVGIAQSPKLIAKVVPPDQSFTNGYAGIFHFHFWLYGKWVNVVVDDRLPYTSDGRFLFCCNKQQPNEYWTPLLEKAYAKLYGNYEVLDAGQTYDALIDMSGGVEESFNLKDLGASKANFWNILSKSFEKKSILGCSINPDPSIREARMTNGLVRGHAYTITRIMELNGEKLIRIRNPWGNEVEWNGAWSDNSREWASVSESDRQEAGLKVEKDGEFWMSFTDFMRNWDIVQVCHLTLDSFSAELFTSEHDEHLMWKCKTYQSEWRTGHSAGGCGSTNQAKFWTNPQFFIKLTDVDEDDNENKATIVIALMQKDSRLKRAKTMKDSAEEFIQFKLFKIKDGVPIDENQSTGLKLYGTQLDRIDSSGSYINSREVTKRFRVDPGNYLIIPSTYDEDRDCEFMLRVFTEDQIDAGSLDEDKDPGDLNDDDTHLDIKKEDTTKAYWQDVMNFICPIIFKGFKNSKNKTVQQIGEFLGPHFNNLANSREASDIASGFASGFSSGFSSGMGEGGLGQGLASGFKSGLSSAFKKFNF
jgi:calpain, invertebrate